MTVLPPDSRPESETGSAGSEASGRGIQWPAAARISALIVGIAAAGLIALLATRDSDGGSIRAASPLIGELVPQLAGEMIWPPDTAMAASEGLVPAGVRRGPDGAARFDIDATSRRWVLVNFFASWCVPCEREHPALAEWSARHRYDGLVVGVPFGDRTVDAIAFYERLGGAWPVVDDPDARWAVAFGVLRPPESFLVTPDGIVAARWQGQISADDPDAVIAALLSGPTSGNERQTDPAP